MEEEGCILYTWLWLFITSRIASSSSLLRYCRLKPYLLILGLDLNICGMLLLFEVLTKWPWNGLRTDWKVKCLYINIPVSIKFPYLCALSQYPSFLIVNSALEVCAWKLITAPVDSALQVLSEHVQLFHCCAPLRPLPALPSSQHRQPVSLVILSSRWCSFSLFLVSWNCFQVSTVLFLHFANYLHGKILKEVFL